MAPLNGKPAGVRGQDGRRCSLGRMCRVTGIMCCSKQVREKWERREKPEREGKKRRREGWKGEWVEKGTEKRQMADTMLRSCTDLLFCDRHHAK